MKLCLLKIHEHISNNYVILHLVLHNGQISCLKSFGFNPTSYLYNFFGGAKSIILM